MQFLSTAPKEKKMREVSLTIPQLLRCTLSGKESWTRRRGSAPAPVASSDLRSLTSHGALRHSVNGGRRKQSPIVSCQQWFAKSYGAQERSQQLPRRSSLPVEVITGAKSMFLFVFNIYFNILALNGVIHVNI